jgi:hypothetical protein
MWVKMGEYADLAIYDVVDEILDMVSTTGRAVGRGEWGWSPCPPAADGRLGPVEK